MNNFVIGALVVAVGVLGYLYWDREHNTILKANNDAISVRGNTGSVIVANNALYAQNGDAIFVSGVVNQDEVKALLALGADDFIKKPFNVAALVKRIAELTGLELAREVSRLRPGLPVILYTGYAEDLSAQQLREARHFLPILRRVVGV